MSSAYSTVIEPVLGRLPAQAKAAAGDSVGAALQIAQNAGPQGELLARAAREAFVSGLGGAMWVAVGVALVGQSIIAAAQDLLAEVGYDALTIEGVADRAGVGKTTVYRRWSDKEQVVLAAIEDFYQDFPFLGWSPDDQSRTWQPGRPWARPTWTRDAPPHAPSGRTVGSSTGAEGTVRSDVDVDHMVASLIGTLMFFVLTGGIDDQPPGLPERITDQILRGILVRRE